MFVKMHGHELLHYLIRQKCNHNPIVRIEPSSDCLRSHYLTAAPQELANGSGGTWLITISEAYAVLKNL